MTPEQIKKRLVFKKATPLLDRAVVGKVSRRDLPENIAEEGHPNDEFESFFQFEEDISDMKSASDQFAETNNSIGYTVMEPDETYNNISMIELEDNNDFEAIVMEEAVLSEDADILDNHADEKISDSSLNSVNNGAIILEEVKEVDISKCEFLKKNKELCKNKKSKGSIYCSVHKNKLIEEIKKANKVR